MLARGVAGRQHREDAMTNSHRIKIKIGTAEFEAEGEQSAVQAQFDAFMRAIEKAPVAPTPPAVESGGPTGERAAASPLGNDERVEQLLASVFEQRQDGIISLKVLPKGDNRDADALMLILFGYARLKGQDDVLATQLLRAAQQSGVSIDRPANTLATYDLLLIRGGQRKGTTYRLNNVGVAKAKEILVGIFK